MLSSIITPAITLPDHRALYNARLGRPQSGERW